MNTRRFVSGSSVILAGWLGATFFNEVPAQRYPKLDRKPVAAAVDSAAGLLVAEVKPAASPTSVSR